MLFIPSSNARRAKGAKRVFSPSSPSSPIFSPTCSSFSSPSPSPAAENTRHQISTPTLDPEPENLAPLSVPSVLSLSTASQSTSPFTIHPEDGKEDEVALQPSVSLGGTAPTQAPHHTITQGVKTHAPWPVIFLTFLMLIFHIFTLGKLKKKKKKTNRPPEIRVLPATSGAPSCVESGNPSERATPTSTLSRIGSLGFTWFSVTPSQCSQEPNDERGLEDDENDTGGSSFWERSPSQTMAAAREAQKDVEEANAKRYAANQRIREELSRLQAWEQLHRRFSVHACSWNVGETEPPSSESPAFREWLLGSAVPSCPPGEAATCPPPALLPDMVVVTLQEVNMSSVVLVREQKTSVHQQWVDRVLETLNNTTAMESGQRVEYASLRTVHLVGLMLMVFIKTEHMPYVSHPRVSVTRCGVMGVLGNKGALAFRTTLYGRRFLFVAAHFSAHKYNEVKRAKDYRATLSDLKFELPENADDEIEVLGTFLASAASPEGHNASDTCTNSSPPRTMGNGSSNVVPPLFCHSISAGGEAAMPLENPCGPIQRLLRHLAKRSSVASGGGPATEIQILDQHDYIFFLGDLNSRLHGLSLEQNLSWIKEGRFDEMLIHDELRQAMVVGEAFDGFEEPWVNFPPTYKYHKNSTEYNTNHQREPAWCDRILFRVGNAEELVECAAERNRLQGGEEVQVESSSSPKQVSVKENRAASAGISCVDAGVPLAPSVSTSISSSPKMDPPHCPDLPSTRSVKTSGSGSGRGHLGSASFIPLNGCVAGSFLSTPPSTASPPTAALMLLSYCLSPSQSSSSGCKSSMGSQQQSPKTDYNDDRKQLRSYHRYHPLPGSDTGLTTSTTPSNNIRQNPSHSNRTSPSHSLVTTSPPLSFRQHSASTSDPAHSHELSTFSAFRASRGGSFALPQVSTVPETVAPPTPTPFSAFSSQDNLDHHHHPARLGPHDMHSQQPLPPCRFPKFANRVQVQGYSVSEDLQQSDHRPVSASFTVDVIHFSSIVAEKMWDAASNGLF